MIDVDYEVIDSAEEKLSQNRPLSEAERRALIRIIEAIRGDYIPTHEESRIHRAQLKQLEQVNYEKQPALWNCLMKSISTYENKYC